MNEDQQINENKDDEKTDKDRRMALKKLGRYAYTAPVMVALLTSKKASALSPPGPPNP